MITTLGRLGFSAAAAEVVVEERRPRVARATVSEANVNKFDRSDMVVLLSWREFGSARRTDILTGVR